MIRYIKLFKLDFRQNLKIFISFNIISVIAYALLSLASKILIDTSIDSVITGRFAYRLNKPEILIWDINRLMFVFLLFQVLLFIAYIFTLIHTKFSNFYGNLYTSMQIPVKRSFHLVPIILEGLLFLAIQYLLLYCILRFDYSYITNKLMQIDSPEALYLKDYFKNYNIIYKFINVEINPFWEFSYRNILYRITLSWTVIASYCILIYMTIYQYGYKKFLLGILVLAIMGVLSTNIEIIRSVLTHISKYGLEFLFYRYSYEKVLNAVIILLLLIATNSYMIKKKVDF